MRCWLLLILISSIPVLDDCPYCPNRVFFWWVKATNQRICPDVARFCQAPDFESLAHMVLSGQASFTSERQASGRAAGHTIVVLFWLCGWRSDADTEEAAIAEMDTPLGNWDQVVAIATSSLIAAAAPPGTACSLWRWLAVRRGAANGSLSLPENSCTCRFAPNLYNRTCWNALKN